MTNTYEHVAVAHPLRGGKSEMQRIYRQGEFLRRNHHLISPWMYTPEQYRMRNHALFLMHFDLAPRPMKPLADGEIAVDELGTIEITAEKVAISASAFSAMLDGNRPRSA